MNTGHVVGAGRVEIFLRIISIRVVSLWLIRRQICSVVRVAKKCDCLLRARTGIQCCEGREFGVHRAHCHTEIRSKFKTKKKKIVLFNTPCQNADKWLLSLLLFVIVGTCYSYGYRWCVVGYSYLISRFSWLFYRRHSMCIYQCARKLVTKKWIHDVQY